MPQLEDTEEKVAEKKWDVTLLDFFIDKFLATEND